MGGLDLPLKIQAYSLYAERNKQIPSQVRSGDVAKFVHSGKAYESSFRERQGYYKSFFDHVVQYNENIKSPLLVRVRPG